jgi:dUTP pyrophosphatase
MLYYSISRQTICTRLLNEEVNMKIGFKKLYEDALIPRYSNELDVGIDLYAQVGCTIHAGKTAILGTGVAWEPIVWTSGTKPCMIVKSRSGLAFNHTIEASGAGVIDSSFRGEIKVKLYNNSDRPYIVMKGDRIAQGIILELPMVDVLEVTELSDTARGANGFGSSGK